METNKIYHGECKEVMKTFSDNCIDLTVTSPPYDNLRTYNGFTFDFEGIAQQLYRITKEGGVVVWVVGDATINGSETGTSFKQALYFISLGFKLHDTMIWAKSTFSSPITNRYHNVFEYMFIFCKIKLKTFNPIIDKKNIKYKTKTKTTFREKNGKTYSRKQQEIKKFGKRYNIWNINEVKNNKEISHPAPFPQQLANDHIISWSNKNDLVLDPFAGSGTTCKMARENHRKFIGIEISEEYIPIIENRIKNAEQNMF